MIINFGKERVIILKEFNLYPKNIMSDIMACIVMLVGSIFVITVGLEKHIISIIDKYPIILGCVCIYSIMGVKRYKNACKSKEYIEQIVLKYESKIMIICSILICILCLINYGLAIIGIISIVFFGLIFVYLMYQRVIKKPTLTFMDESFIDRATMLGIGEINYSDIKGTYIHNFNGNKQLIILVENIEDKIKKLSLIKRIFNFDKKYVDIPQSSVQIPLEQVEILIKKYIAGEFK